MSNIRLFGFRVLVERVPEKTGRIITPDNAEVMYKVGRVVVVGDGKQPNGTVEEPLVKVGDLVWFQVNAVLAANQQYMMGNNPLINLHQGDLLCRLHSPESFYSNMEPLGRWVFVEPFTRQEDTLIALPAASAAGNSEFVYFRVSKLGSRVDLPIKPKQEILLNTGRIGAVLLRRNPIEDDFVDLGYIDRDYVLGAVEEAEEAT